MELEFDSLLGTAELPISVVAQTPGEVVLTGKTEFRVSGKHVVVSGLVFRDCLGVDNVLQMRTDTKVLAQNFRVTDCVFEQPAGIESSKETTWLAVYGANHRIDHCHFSGKKTAGATIVVWVAEEPEKHQIDHNFFGPRPKLGQNGGETMGKEESGTGGVRIIGQGHRVINNYFEGLRGDDGLMRPTESNPLQAKALTKMEVKTDIDGQPRGDVAIAGCDEPNTPLRKFPSPADTGPVWRQTAIQ